ncbi:MAG: hypothetical protein OXT67_12065 [Zetaproteobacteria bacterium]|nr:hypothetical protein [Zetaproteobacteria bacterium]
MLRYYNGGKDQYIVKITIASLTSVGGTSVELELPDNDLLEVAAFEEGQLRAWGWYLYVSGEVKGPYGLAQLVSYLEYNHLISPECWVARKGFSQWYPAAQLIQAYSLKAFERGTNSAVVAPSAVCDHRLSEASSVASKEDTQHPSQMDTAFHFEVRARLRLGRLYAPWRAFLKTLCIPVWGWWSWLEESFLEGIYHLGEAKRTYPRNFFFCWLPGVHLWYVYKFIRLISALETQNKDYFLRPHVAMCLALFPPLFACYAQAALTRHWKLHMKSLLVRYEKFAKA